MLEMASAYWQVSMDSSSQEKTAFSTYVSLYEFKKMPFRLINASATFQHIMEVALARLVIELGCVSYREFNRRA